MIPFSSRTVAYWLLASGHDTRVHKPVKLYSCRQKFRVSVLIRTKQMKNVSAHFWLKLEIVHTYLTLCEQNDLLMILHTTCENTLISKQIPLKLLIENHHTYIVALHFDQISFSKWVQIDRK